MSRTLNIHRERRVGGAGPSLSPAGVTGGPNQTADSCVRHEETISFAGLTRKKGAGQNLNAAGLILISGQRHMAASLV